MKDNVLRLYCTGYHSRTRWEDFVEGVESITIRGEGQQVRGLESNRNWGCKKTWMQVRKSPRRVEKELSSGSETGQGSGISEVVVGNESERE